MSFGQRAEGTKEWDRFWGSGKVEDYLRYKNCCMEEESSEGVKSVHAGFFAGDRNCNKVHPCGGV